jgi:hypothetical protein
MCQLSAGAPVMVWTDAPEGSFAWTKGRPRAYRSSATAERLFCPDCGTQLAFRPLDEGPDALELNVVTLDDASRTAPGHHIWTASRLPWFETGGPAAPLREGAERVRLAVAGLAGPLLRTPNYSRFS